MINTNNPFEIKIWAQMFFDDGSVSQGLRVPADTYDDDRAIDIIVDRLLASVNRQEGYLLLWGAGEVKMYKYPTSSSS